jgi:hypothetical protein
MSFTLSLLKIFRAGITFHKPAITIRKLTVMRKLMGLLLFLLFVLFYSCQQEVFEMPLEGCKIIKGHYYGGGGMHDSAQFIYDEQGKLIKWINMDGFYNYYYNGNNIIARIYRENGGSVWYIDSVNYNSNNTISEIVFYDFSGLYTPDTLHNKVIFYYQGNRVTNLKTVEFVDQGFGIETDTTHTTFTWDPAGNIEKIKFVNNGYWGFDDSVLYRYDANPNYFKLVHPHFFLFEPQFDLQVGFETQLAYFYSMNNVTNFNVYGSWDYPVVYGIDSLNNVTKVDMGGFPYFEYEYECANPARRP